MEAQEGITFQCLVKKVQTMEDGGWRVTLDVPEDEAPQILQLAQFVNNHVLQVGIVPVEGASIE